MRKICILFLVYLVLFTSCISINIRKPSFQERASYVKNNPSLETRIKQATLEGKIITTMNKKDVEATWGKPNNISNHSGNKFLEQDEESWEYNRLFAIPIVIHFKENIVIGIYDDLK